MEKPTDPNVISTNWGTISASCPEPTMILLSFDAPDSAKVGDDVFTGELLELTFQDEEIDDLLENVRELIRDLLQINLHISPIQIYRLIMKALRDQDFIVVEVDTDTGEV